MICLLSLTGCTVGSGASLMSQENNTSSMMSMSYAKFSGYKETTVKVEAEKPVTVSVNIVSEDGTIDAAITKQGDTEKVIYQGKDVPTSAFEVELKEEGAYTIRVDAQNHSGSYSFTWK